MNSSVQVVSLVRGEQTSVRHLSPRRERRDVLVASAITAVGIALAMAVVTMVEVHFGRVLYAPGFFFLWLSVAGLAVWTAVRRVQGRARTYRVGSAIDADAFAPVDADLIRRAPGGYELNLVPGMKGTFEREGERHAIAVESLTHDGPIRVPFSGGQRLTLSWGSSVFVIRWVEQTVIERAGPPLRRLFHIVASAVPVAALLSVLFAVPQVSAVTELDSRSSIPVGASPWDVEKLLRAQAQRQSSALHACFDAMPTSCQKAGFVGVGLSLSKEGEVRNQWVSRSTYGAECPVAACMSEIIARWYFEPLPRPMQVVLPVQVLRTGKPIVVPTDGQVPYRDLVCP